MLGVAVGFHQVHAGRKGLTDLVFVVEDTHRFGEREIIGQVGKVVTEMEEAIEILGLYLLDRDLKDIYHPGELPVLNFLASILNKIGSWDGKF